MRRAPYYHIAALLLREAEPGRLYLELGRPRQAIEVLSPALRGSIEASNLYVTHTDVHTLLARAHYNASGAPDNARV